MLKRVLNSIKTIYSGNIHTPNTTIQNVINVLDDDQETQHKSTNKYQQLKTKHQKQGVIDYQYDDYAIKTNTQSQSFQDLKQQLNITSTQTSHSHHKPQTQHQHQPSQQSVPFMITRQMKLDLIDLGYSIPEIKKMKPIQAQQILNQQSKNQQ